MYGRVLRCLQMGTGLFCRSPITHDTKSDERATLMLENREAFPHKASFVAGGQIRLYSFVEFKSPNIIFSAATACRLKIRKTYCAKLLTISRKVIELHFLLWYGLSSLVEQLWKSSFYYPGDRPICDYATLMQPNIINLL